MYRYKSEYIHMLYVCIYVKYRVELLCVSHLVFPEDACKTVCTLQLFLMFSTDVSQVCHVFIHTQLGALRFPQRKDLCGIPQSHRCFCFFFLIQECLLRRNLSKRIKKHLLVVFFTTSTFCNFRDPCGILRFEFVVKDVGGSVVGVVRTL